MNLATLFGSLFVNQTTKARNSYSQNMIEYNLLSSAICWTGSNVQTCFYLTHRDFGMCKVKIPLTIPIKLKFS